MGRSLGVPGEYTLYTLRSDIKWLLLDIGLHGYDITCLFGGSCFEGIVLVKYWQEKREGKKREWSVLFKNFIT